MTDEQLGLARALVTHPRWPRHAAVAYRDAEGRPCGRLAPGALPDLTDDATSGVLLGMLAESDTVVVWAWAEGARVLVGEGEVWMDGSRWAESTGATLAEAAARALLACWGEP